MLDKRHIYTIILLTILVTSCFAQNFFRQSPYFDKLVKNGDLPPVEDRLPENPVLIQPTDNTGQYGGCLSMGMIGRDHVTFMLTIGYENLTRWDAKWQRIIPNVAQSFKQSKDGSTFTFILRKGLRWSDGYPFTAHDILFWYNDVLLNKELTKSIPVWLKCNNEPVTLTMLDDFTVEFKFSTTNNLFMQQLSHPLGAEPTCYPKHYLKKFHPKYNPNILQLVKKYGVKNWVELFELKFGSVKDVGEGSRWNKPDVPTLNAWVLRDRLKQAQTNVTAVRNPYYWKIDPNFNQLPYIDSCKFVICNNVDDYNRNIVDKKINFGTKHSETLLKLLEQEESFTKFKMVPELSNICAISLNLTHKDSITRELFQNKSFRIGLSHAINREHIIQKIYNSNQEPYQVAPKMIAPYYHEKLAHQYLEYNVHKANSFLDNAGIANRDDNHFRLLKNGKPVKITIDFVELPESNYEWEKLLLAIQQDWINVGVQLYINKMSRIDFYKKKMHNDHDANIWTAPGGFDILMEPRFYFPFSDESNYAIPWAYWFENPHNPLAEEPPQQVKEQFNTFNQIISEPTQNQPALINELLDIAAEQFYVMGICQPADHFGQAVTNLKNIPKVMPQAWSYPTPAPTNLCQYYFDTKTLTR